MPSPTALGATALVPTTSGSRYLQQLCKHWSHKLHVKFTPEQGTVTFSEQGAAHFAARDDALEVRIEAGSAEQLTELQDVVARHLDRFAFREAPLRFDWA